MSNPIIIMIVPDQKILIPGKILASSKRRSDLVTFSAT